MKILIVDDHAILRSSLSSHLSALTGFSFLGAANGKEALELFQSELFDLVILDVEMPVMNGRETFLQLRKLNPTIKVIILTYLPGHANILFFILHKANGFLKKHDTPEEMAQAIRSVWNGETHFNEEVIEAVKAKLPKILGEVKKLKLTRQELDLIRSLKKGMTSKTIATKRDLTQKTIDTYRERILSKTNTKNVAELIAFASKNGLLHVEE